MKTSTTFSSEFLRSFNTVILLTRMNDGWQTKWEILLNDDGNPFTEMEDAIAFVRSKKMGWGIGLSDVSQAKMENAQWDSL